MGLRTSQAFPTPPLSFCVCLPVSHEALNRIGKEITYCPYGPPSRWARSLSLMGEQPTFQTRSFALASALTPCVGRALGPLSRFPDAHTCSAILCHALQNSSSAMSYLLPTVGQPWARNFFPILRWLQNRDLFRIWSLHTLPLSKVDFLEACPFQHLPAATASLEKSPWVLLLGRPAQLITLNHRAPSLSWASLGSLSSQGAHFQFS